MAGVDRRRWPRHAAWSSKSDRWFAVEAPRDPKTVLAGRLEALGPIFVEAGAPEEPLLLHLESEGAVLRARIDGRAAWCDRRLLARIHRYTLDRLRQRDRAGHRGAVPAVPRRAGNTSTRSIGSMVRPAWPRPWTSSPASKCPRRPGKPACLPSRVRGYKREWLDQLTLSGTLAWGRLWGAGQSPVRRTPIALVPRDQLDTWTSLAAATVRPDPGPTASEVLDVLKARGAMFVQEIAKATRLPAASVEEGLGALLAAGRVTCDSFGGLRWLLLPGWRRRTAGVSSGRWSLLHAPDAAGAREPGAVPPAEFVAKRLLRRTGVLFRRTMARERIPVPWRDIARACRLLEARGDVRGGRFVGGFDGEQYALPEAVTLLRKIRRAGPRPLGSGPLSVSAADPLNYQGILTPDEKVASSPTVAVRVG